VPQSDSTALRRLLDDSQTPIVVSVQETGLLRAREDALATTPNRDGVLL
jgi:hypothetical protein